MAESETEQAEEFNGQFTDVFSKTSENEVPPLEKSPPMSDIHISNECVIKMMKGLILDAGGQVDTFILDLEKAFDLLLMNF